MYVQTGQFEVSHADFQAFLHFVHRRTSSPQELRDKAKYPTVASMSVSDNVVMNNFLKHILTNFEWTTVFFLCDVNEEKILFYIVNCANLKRILRGTGRFLIHEAIFNSSAANESVYLHAIGKIPSVARGT